MYHVIINTLELYNDEQRLAMGSIHRCRIILIVPRLELRFPSIGSFLVFLSLLF